VATDLTRRDDLRLTLVWKKIQEVSANKTTTTLLLFGYFVAKILCVARGDLLTGLAVLSESGLVAVVLGALVSSLPVLAAVTLAVSLHAAIADGSRAHPRWFWYALGAVALLTLWFTPWYLTVGAIALAVILGVWDQGHPVRGERGRARAGATVLAAVLVVVGLYSTLLTMWLPHEALTVAGGQRVGYVINVNDRWTTVLITKSRRVEHLRTDEITSRTTCRGGDFHSSLADGLARVAFHHQFNHLHRCPT